MQMQVSHLRLLPDFLRLVSLQRPEFVVLQSHRILHIPNFLIDPSQFLLAFAAAASIHVHRGCQLGSQVHESHQDEGVFGFDSQAAFTCQLGWLNFVELLVLDCAGTLRHFFGHCCLNLEEVHQSAQSVARLEFFGGFDYLEDLLCVEGVDLLAIDVEEVRRRLGESALNFAYVLIIILN